ncbi:MAG TPA: N-acetylmuramoyl-L-alanine amidase [Desulfotomaculum sp.]|nr:N-acetylmuramoyl-L-alanine amidase [Desulfotomaculum sp.]
MGNEGNMAMSLKQNIGQKLKVGLVVSLIYTAGCLVFPAAAFSATDIIVKGSTVNLRSAPGTANSIVTTVQSGQRFQVLDTQGDWYKINAGNKTGWIAGWLVDTSASANTQPQQQISTQKIKQATITGSAVNVRSGPGTSYGSVTSVSKGSKYTVTEASGQWLKIKLSDGKQGWIAGWLAAVNEVNVANPPSGGTTVVQQPQVDTKVKQATITASAVNVRSGPGTSYGSVTSVSKGAKYTVTEVSGQWLKIKLSDGKQGWIAGWLAAVTEIAVANPAPDTNPPPATNNPTTPPNSNGSTVALVNGNEVNIRLGPGTGHNVITRVSRGQRVGVLERNGDWAKVQLDGGIVGWVAGWMLIDTAEASPSPGDPPVETPDTDQTGEPDQPAEPVRLEQIEINEQDGHTYVQLKAQGPLSYDMFMLTGPERLVLDLKNVDPTDLPEKIEVGSEAVSQLRTGWLTQEPPVMRLVFDLKGTVANLDKLSDDRTQLNLDIFIPKPGSFLNGRVIAIDAGHGGSDPGATGPTGLREKDVTLDLALRLQKILTEHGAKVVMTRSNDSFVDLYERTAIAERNGVEVFLSIHINANPSRDKNGTSTYYRRDTGDLAPGVNQADNRKLASLVQSELLRTLGRRSLGVLQSNFVVLRTSPVPAALAEVAFVSNYEEEQMLRQDTVRQKVAESLAQSLNNYFAPTK